MKKLQRNNEVRQKLEEMNLTGFISEQELLEIAGGSDVSPDTSPLTTSSWTCITAGVTVSASLCPTTKCTSQC